FRAAAADRAAVDYAVSDDPGGASPSGSWSTRGSTTYAAPVTKVSTVGVNAQTDSTLNAELFGEVKINFSSETLPLERFIDDAQRVLLERAARPAVASVARKTSQSAPPPVAPPPVAPPPAAEQPAPTAVPVAAPAPAPAPQPGAPACPRRAARSTRCSASWSPASALSARAARKPSPRPASRRARSSST